MADCRDIPSPATSCEDSQALPVILQTAKSKFTVVCLVRFVCEPSRTWRLVQMILLVESLKYTGCGDAFAQLKVCSQYCYDAHVRIAMPALQNKAAAQPVAIVMKQTTLAVCRAIGIAAGSFWQHWCRHSRTSFPSRGGVESWCCAHAAAGSPHCCLYLVLHSSCPPQWVVVLL